MESLTSDRIMFIEPEKPFGESLFQVTEDYTRDSQRARAAMILLADAEAPSNDLWFRGVHTCVCGAKSDNIPWKSHGYELNSLLVHYLMQHGDEVPASELAKLDSVPDDLTPENELLMSAIRTIGFHIGFHRLNPDCVFETFVDPDFDDDIVGIIRITINPVSYEEHSQFESRVFELLKVFHQTDGYLVDIRQRSR